MSGLVAGEACCSTLAALGHGASNLWQAPPTPVRAAVGKLGPNHGEPRASFDPAMAWRWQTTAGSTVAVPDGSGGTDVSTLDAVEAVELGPDDGASELLSNGKADDR